MTSRSASSVGGAGGGYPESTSTSLLQRARAQDPEAWRRLVRLYGPLVFRWCRLSQIQASDAADVVQDVFHSVLGALGKFRRDRPGDSFRGWLWTITRNKIRDYRRRSTGRPRAAGGTDAQERIQQVPELPPNTDELGEHAILVHRALLLIRPEFEDRTWQAFWRSAVQDEPTAEIAVDLGMTKGAVRQAKYRVLARLRQEVEDLG